MKRKALLAVSLSVLLVLAIATAAFAQGANPPATPKAPAPGKAVETVKKLADRAGLDIFGGGWKIYDAVAAALKLTPTQLFEQLHSGKTLKQIAEAQGVDMQVVQNAIKAARQAQAREAIQKALENGKITREQADWMLKGLENGWQWPKPPRP